MHVNTSKAASKAHSKTIASKAPVSATARTYSNASKAASEAHLKTTVSKAPVSTTVRTHTNASKVHLQTTSPTAPINKQTTKRLIRVYVK